jgi:hypothetical protein
MPNDSLDLDLRVLLLKYGRPQVLQNLARLGKASPEELERRLDELSKKAPRKRKGPPSPEEAVDHLQISDPLIKERLLALALEFDRKRFLPEMRDVVRFCQQQGLQTRAKSRREMLPKILKILASFPVTKLDELLEHMNDQAGGSFARLADAIMRGT